MTRSAFATRVPRSTLYADVRSAANGTKLFPRTATLAAPTLFKPGDRSGFKMREIVDFD
jgi:hypothetical protein